MTNVPIEELFKHFAALKDTDYEPGFDKYMLHLEGLNETCRSAGDLLEGNLFYGGPRDFASNLAEPPEAAFRTKRRGYATYVLSGTSMLEIGFNGGHSALLALSVNPRLKYFGVDYGNHPYTRPCFEYLRGIFGDRIDLWIGDSRELIPAVRHASGLKFDLFHIDGGHDFGTAYADMCNVIDICDKDDVILFDDTNSGLTIWHIDEVCEFFAMRGLVTPVACPLLLQSNRHVLLKVNK
jgi:hypothetical protein